MQHAQKIWYGILFLCFVPVLLWFLAPTFLPRFSGGLVGMSADVAKLFGLVGATMFSINLILSARLPFLIRWMHGLHLLYSRHQKLGKYGFYLVLLHPVLLLPQYAGADLGRITRFFFEIDNLPRLWGKLALLSFTVLVILTLYYRPKYHVWKRTHQWMGIAFLFTALHIYYIPSDVAVYAPLRWYMLTIAGLGLLAYTYHTVLGRWLIRRTTYVVTGVRNLQDMVTHVTMKPANQALAYESGQFVFASFRDPVVSSETHPFTLSSNAEAKEISISAKRSGDFTATLPRLSVGSKVFLEGPYGEFTAAQANASRQIWIAGGIGITPFLSMAKSFRSGQGLSVDLFYCTKNPQEAVFYDDLKKIADALPLQFRLHTWCSDNAGYLSAAQVEKELGSLAHADIFICAPPPMIRSLRKQFQELGAAPDRLHSEEFSYP